MSQGEKHKNKDQQGKATFTERSHRNKPVTPVGYLEGTEQKIERKQ
jgi:hypothetical protein